MTEENELTHWLHNPNKLYLGHQDLPNGEDVVLTILSAKSEEVKNPILNTTENKRVIRFIEQNNWVKPFICNETNAAMLLKVTGEKYMEKCKGKKIKIGISQTNARFSWNWDNRSESSSGLGRDAIANPIASKLLQ